jgi:hypothetical protein
MRRRIPTILAVLIVLFKIVSVQLGSQLIAADLNDSLKPLIEAHAGDVAVCIRHLETGEQFVWRGDERIKSKDDIFPPEENEMDAKIQAEKKVEMAKENVPLEPSKETLDYDKNNPKPMVK